MVKHTFVLLFSLLVFIFVSISCEDQVIQTELNSIKPNKEISFKAPTIVVDKLPTQRFNSVEMSGNYNVFMGVGYPGSKKIHEESLLDPSDYTAMFSDNYDPNYSDQIKIIVDDSQIISTQVYKYSPLPITDSMFVHMDLEDYPDSFFNQEPEITEYEGYPVFIYNYGKTYTNMAMQDGSFIMIQEAKDADGNWRPIEFWQYSWCGNSYYDIVIDPGQYALSKIFRYEGRRHTEMRIKLRSGNNVFYSNSYRGSMNPEQFELSSQDSEDFVQLYGRKSDPNFKAKIFLEK